MAKNKNVKVERPASKNAPDGNFSRRHQTDEAHVAAQAAWELRQQNKKARVSVILFDAANDSPNQKIGELNLRLGNGVGADKERAKLRKQLVSA